MLPDLSLAVTQRKLACVLDPTLVLGYALGPTLALRLTRVFEAWLTRSFWQIIDASELLLRTSASGTDQDHRFDSVRPNVHALSAWIAMRDRTDAGSWSLRWMGDCLAESQMRDGGDPDLVDRYEMLAAALMARVSHDGDDTPSWSQGLDPIVGALDTLALSASLDGALVLCPRAADDRSAPWPVQALARAGVQAIELEPMPSDTLFASERAFVREALVTAGLATVAQKLPRLIAVHVVVGEDENPGTSSLIESDAAIDPWEDARAWWYRV